MTEIDYDALAGRLVEHMQAGTFARPLMSPGDVAKALGVSDRQARELVKEGGSLKSFKVGGLRRVDPREFDRYLAELQRE